MTTTTMLNLQPGDLLRLLEKIAAENPTRVYEKQAGDACLYVHTDPWDGERTPGCIVGHVLIEAGLDFDTLVSWEENGADAVIEGVALGYTEYELSVLAQAQSAQDRGVPWGEAVEQGKRVADQIGLRP